MRYLLSAGAAPHLRDTLNRRPAEIALMCGYVDIVAEFAPPTTSSPSLAFCASEDQPRVLLW